MRSFWSAAWCALALASLATHARAQDAAPSLRLPECAAEHVDVALLRELLAIELADAGAIEIEIGETLCDASEPRLDLEVRDPRTARVAHERILLAIDAEPDLQAAARAVALAIAERAPRVLRSLEDDAPSEPEETTPPPADAMPAPPPLEPASALGVPDAPPETTPTTTTTPAPPLPATLGLAIRGRVAPVLPSWALGLRADLGASIDATWSIRGELFATWTRASPSEGDVDAVVIAAAGLLGASVYRTSTLDLVVAGRAEAGVLASFGWQGAASTGAATLHPWLSAGGELDLSLWLDPGLALVFDVALTGVIYGTRIVTWPSGTQIDLSLVTIDLGAGIRIPL